MGENMGDINFKIKEMQNLIESINDDDVKISMRHVLEDIRLLQTSEIQSENSWESCMMALVGTDGIGGVKRIIIKMLEVLESIATMPPETAEKTAQIKAHSVLELISDEKILSRSEHPLFKKF